MLFKIKSLSIPPSQETERIAQISIQQGKYELISKEYVIAMNQDIVKIDWTVSMYFLD
jgi:hypothetical protein